MPLVVRFTRTSPTHHRMEIVRSDGEREDLTLETRSCLVHDLVHFALESEAALTQSFYGRMARGASYADLADPAAPGQEILETERVVGALQGALARDIAPAAFRARFAENLTSIGETPPEWLTEELLMRVQEHLRRLRGEWRATPFGASMQLAFDGC